MQRQYRYKFYQRYVWGLIFLLLAVAMPAFAHPGSGIPSYFSIDLCHLTTANPNPTDPDDNAGPIAGAYVLMRVKIEHGNLSTINSVSVSASEQTGNWPGQMQILSINGFAFETSIITGTGDSTLITEYWKCIVDTRSDYNTAGWPNTLLQRNPTSFVAQMFNATYNFQPVVNFSMLGVNISSNDYSIVTGEEIPVVVQNLNITNVQTNVNTRYLIYNPQSTNINYHNVKLTFTIEDNVNDNISYVIYFIFWPTKSGSNPQPSDMCYAVATCTDPGTYTTPAWDLPETSAYNFDILAIKYFGSNEVDSQWFKSYDAGFSSDDLNVDDNLEYSFSYSTNNGSELFDGQLDILSNDDTPPVLNFNGENLPLSTGGVVSFAEPSPDAPIRAVLSAMVTTAIVSRDHTNRPCYCLNNEPKNALSILREWSF